MLGLPMRAICTVTEAPFGKLPDAVPCHNIPTTKASRHGIGC
jgi:hypothetical protein